MSILTAKDLDLSFYSSRARRNVHAVDHVSMSLEPGEFLGLVGESGCGKSTLAKMLAGLLKPDSGTILMEGEPLVYPYRRNVYRNLQMVFQMPQESFDPRRRIGPCLVDMQRGFGVSKAEAMEQTCFYLERVGLNRSFFDKFPHQMSGGECQRAAIARALVIHPKVILCDEITSALDVSVQAQVVELLQEINEDMGISMLFISHDLALVQSLCSRILVMNQGVIVDQGSPRHIIDHSENKYVKQLLDAVLTVQ